MKALVACEASGAIRRELRVLGIDAWSCDLKPAEDGSAFHIQGDVRPILSDGWDAMIAHPECRYLSVSGQHWISRGRIEADGRPRAAHRDEALAFAGLFFNATQIPVRIVEQPVSILSTHFRKPDAIVHPYMFGDDASKATCLWTWGGVELEIPPQSEWVPPRYVMDFTWGIARPRWANQTDSGQNRLAPSNSRSEDRARTYPGIARFTAKALAKALNVL